MGEAVCGASAAIIASWLERVAFNGASAESSTATVVRAVVDECA